MWLRKETQFFPLSPATRESSERVNTTLLVRIDNSLNASSVFSLLKNRYSICSSATLACLETCLFFRVRTMYQNNKASRPRRMKKMIHQPGAGGHHETAGGKCTSRNAASGSLFTLSPYSLITKSPKIGSPIRKIIRC